MFLSLKHYNDSMMKYYLSFTTEETEAKRSSVTIKTQSLTPRTLYILILDTNP